MSGGYQVHGNSNGYRVHEKVNVSGSDRTQGLFSIKMDQLIMVHMFQDQLHNPVLKLSTMQHALQEWL